MTSRAVVFLAVFVVLCGCGRASDNASGTSGSTQPNSAGLVSLPCDGSTPLQPVKSRYCTKDRHYVLPEVRNALVEAANALAKINPDNKLYFMDASGANGTKPFPPHLSHGDGRQIDLGLYYTDTAGNPLYSFPDTSRHGGYWPAEPPRANEQNACPEGRTPRAEKPDPPTDRPWRLDEDRTRILVQKLADDPRVKRILIEPHLERRLGFWGHPKLRFAGCQAARHDDHLHVDFH